MILMKSKKDILINCSIFGAIILGYVGVTFFTSHPELKSLSYESSSSQVQLQSLNSNLTETITLKRFRGQTLLINFWASWCKACESEQPSLEKLALAFNKPPINSAEERPARKE